MPLSVQVFLRRRFLELWGLILVLGGGFLFLSLWTYYQQDASWNTLAAVASQNSGGPFGSYLSDTLLQLFGFASYGLGFVMVSWGGSFVIRKRLPFSKVRFIFLPLALVCLSIGFAPLVFPVDIWVGFSPGGSVGFVLYNQLIRLVSVLPLGLSPMLWSWMFLILGVALFLFVCGIPLSTWEAIGRYILKSLHALWGMIFSWMKKRYEKRQEASMVKTNLFRDTESVSMEAAPIPKPVAKKMPAPPKKAVRKTVALSIPRSIEGYTFPPFHLLQSVDPDAEQTAVHKKSLKDSAEMLKSVLDDFGVEGEITKVRPGPVVTLYELKPAPGTKSARVVGLADDIARSMSATSARIAVIPGYNALGIELPNEDRKTVYLRTLLEDATYQNASAHLPLALGRNIGGDPVISDLARMPHLLVAGTTGSGKSVSINTMILSLLYRLTPEQCRFIMIDPKMLELSVYDGIPHLLTPVVTDPHKAVMALKWAVREMESRYQAMAKLNVRNIDGYNKRIRETQAKGESLSRKMQTGFDPETGQPIYEEQEIPLKSLPYIVVVVDEMADLMLVAGKDIEGAVQRLAQMARAAGIHLIMATQRPSVDVITGTIKANFPTRISFNVTSKIDSRTILGEMGAEQLLGQGDMLFMATGGRVTRVHGPFVGDDEVERITTFLKSQGDPDYETSVTEEQEGGGFLGDDAGGGSGDILYDQALQLILTERKASTSFIQRHLQIGYNRAARIMDRLESEGVVSSANHVGKREVLLKGSGV